MPKSKPKQFSSPRAFARTSSVSRSGRAEEETALGDNFLTSSPRAKLLLVDFRSGEAVRQHPEVVPFVNDGWLITGAAPRVTQEGTRLLVVLAPPGSLAGVSARHQYAADA